MNTGRNRRALRHGVWGAAAAAGMAISTGIVLTVGQPAFAAAITVTTTADTVDAAVSCVAVTLPSLPGPDGQVSLREAVCAANSNAGGDVITFAVNGTFALAGAANEDNGGSGDLDVKDSVQISGNGPLNTILSGNANERLFDVFPASAITFGLSDLTLRNGDTRSTSFKEGGALYLHNNVTSTLDAVHVVDNFAGSNGAIENRGNLTIIAGVIARNQTVPAAGSVVGGGIHNTGTLTITDTTIADNSVRGEGGGIATSTLAGVTVSISRTTFSGNAASVAGGALGNGGALSTTGNQGTITLTNVTMSGNRADSSGGGAFLTTTAGGTGNVTLDNVTVTDNVADADGNGSGSGGGLAQTVSAVTLRNTIVAGNVNTTVAARDDIAGALVAASANNLVGDGTGASGVTDGANGNLVGSSVSAIDPLLRVLENNGGLTRTHALLVGSQAIDAGNPATCAPADQRSVARLGNCDIGAFEFTDTTPPDTTITATPANPAGTATASFSFTGSDAGGIAGFQCRLDSGAFAACTSPTTYTGLADGSHTFEVRAVDNAGNVDPTPASFTWTVDTVAPDTTITATPANPAGTATASFSFTGSDAGGSGVGGFQCRLDSGAFATCTSPTTFTGLADGPHTFEFRAVDNAGNIDPTPATSTWTVDTTAPDTTITATPADPAGSTTASFSFTGSDIGGTGVAFLQCRLDGGAFAACSSPTTSTGLADGSHTFEVRAVDNAGNIDPTPATYTWTVDTTAPDTTITATPADPTGSTTATFGFTGTDPGGTGASFFECRLDGGVFTPCTAPATFTGLTEGPHTFAVRAVDLTGNIDATPATYTWTVDTTAPDTTITTTPAGTTTSTTASFTFSGAAGTTSFECRLDGAAFAPCTSPATLTGLAVGPHTFDVRAVDSAGNADPTPATFVWTVEAVVVTTTTTVPTTTVPPTTTTTTTTVPVSTTSTTIAPNRNLPITGSNGIGSTLGVAIALCGSGALLVALRGRRRPA